LEKLKVDFLPDNMFVPHFFDERFKFFRERYVFFREHHFQFVLVAQYGCF